ncbi:MAG: response regulator transcription factor [Cytophagales bacterium]
MSVVGYMNLSSLPCDGFSLLMRSLSSVKKVFTFREPKTFENLNPVPEFDLLVIDYDEIVFNHETIKMLEQKLPKTKFLLLFSTEQTPDIIHVIAQTNHSCWNKSDDTNVILHIIQSVLNNIRIVSPECINASQHKKSETLSEREVEIAMMLIKGKSSLFISEQLNISPHTVHTHRKNIFKKLGVHSTLELSKLKMI